jgi:signal transduction histidine kinase
MAKAKTSDGIWNRLTAPHPSITDIEEQRQSQLLSGIILAVVSMSLLATALMAARSGLGPIVFETWGGLSVSLVLYLLNRAGHYRVSSTIFVGQNFLLVYGISAASNDLSWLFFGVMLVILSAILLPWRGTIGMVVLSLAAQVGLIVLHPLSSNMTNYGVMIIFIVTAPLMLVFMNHRNRLEKERQAELRAANARLRESEVVLEHRVEERTADLKVAKEQAEAARERAEKADQIKSQFLASMSHELRTPLNAILNFTEMMALEMVGPVSDAQKDLLNKSLDSSQHLLALINDVLDVSKMQSGMLTLFVEDDIDLQQELAPIIDTTESLLKTKQVRLVKDIDAGLPHISGDKRRIRQVLLNLVANAVKFTETGTITVSAKALADTVLFVVADTGPGLTKDEQRVIFEPFIQTETGIQHAGGTGLGLPISKGLVEAHGGKLWVDSTAGQGAAFSFTIPRNRLLKAEGGI